MKRSKKLGVLAPVPYASVLKAERAIGERSDGGKRLRCEAEQEGQREYLRHALSLSNIAKNKDVKKNRPAKNRTMITDYRLQFSYELFTSR